MRCCVLWIAPFASAGTSSGEISVSGVERSVVEACSSSSFEFITQRTRYWISVFATEPFTL